MEISNTEADIFEYVVPGENDIRVEILSNFFNAVKVTVDSLLTDGDPVREPTRYSEEPFQDFGLVGPVTTKVFRKLIVQL